MLKVGLLFPLWVTPDPIVLRLEEVKRVKRLTARRCNRRSLAEEGEMHDVHVFDAFWV
jgi:hypothetical protein